MYILPFPYYYQQIVIKIFLASKNTSQNTFLRNDVVHIPKKVRAIIRNNRNGRRKVFDVKKVKFSSSILQPEAVQPTRNTKNTFIDASTWGMVLNERYLLNDACIVRL